MSDRRRHIAGHHPVPEGTWVVFRCCAAHPFSHDSVDEGALVVHEFTASAGSHLVECVVCHMRMPDRLKGHGRKKKG